MKAQFSKNVDNNNNNNNNFILMYSDNSENIFKKINYIKNYTAI